jgi:hypothetical protein
MRNVAPNDAMVKRGAGALAVPREPIAEVERLQEEFERLSASCNLLCPVAAIDSIPAMHAISLRAVMVDGATNQYGQGPEVYKDSRFCQQDEVALGGVALQKLMAAAGVSVVGKRRLDDRSDPFYCDMEVTLAVREYDGTYRQWSAGKEVDLRNGAPETQKPERVQVNNRWEKTGKMVSIEPSALADKRRHIQSLAETKATYRALRKLLQVKQKYTRAELAKPFVIPKLVPRLDASDPDQKQALIAMATGADVRLFGGGATQQSEGRLLRDVTPHSGGDAAPALPEAEGEPAPSAETPAPASQPEPIDIDDFELVEPPRNVCTCPCGCQGEITADVAAITKERVGAPRCGECFPGKRFSLARHEHMPTMGYPDKPGMTPQDAEAARVRASGAQKGGRR